MTEKEVVAKELKIKQKAVFDMGELYQVMFRWFSQHNYDFQEKQYMEKKNPDGGKNLEIKWIATRKINDYVKYQIDIIFKMVNLVEVEVEVDGRKTNKHKANSEIEFNATLMKNYENKWDKNAFLRFIREVYDMYIIRSRMEDYKAELYSEIYELIDEVKAFLNMYKFEGITI